MEKYRIFIAIDVPEELKSIAEKYIEPILGDKHIRIPKKEGWHITVVFCGYLDEKEIGALVGIAENAVLKFKPFEFTPCRILFAPANHQRMIWLDFEKSSQFASLKKEIEDAIASSQSRGLFKNFRPETREPNPHFTLARFEESYFVNIKSTIPREGIDLKGEARAFLINSIDIMESHLSREGAEYKLIRKTKF